MGGPIAVHLGIQQQLHQRQRATQAGRRQQRRHAPRVSALLQRPRPISHRLRLIFSFFFPSRSEGAFPTSPSYIALINPNKTPLIYIYILLKTHEHPL